MPSPSAPRLEFGCSQRLIWAATDGTRASEAKHIKTIPNLRGLEVSLTSILLELYSHTKALLKQVKALVLRCLWTCRENITVKTIIICPATRHISIAGDLSFISASFRR